jgi:hypothetical protein
MAKNKKKVGDDDVLKPIELPEEEDKVLSIPTEDDELLDEDADEEDEEVEEEGDVF